MIVDLSKPPDFSLSTSPEAKIVSHRAEGQRVELCLGDDDILRVDGHPTSLYRHHYQSSDNDILTVGQLEVELTKMNVAAANLAEALFHNVNMVPRHWNQEMSLFPGNNGGIIFWGTKVKTISGTEGFPILESVPFGRDEFQSVFSVISVTRCIRFHSSLLILL